MRPTPALIRSVSAALEETYHSPRHGNPSDPLEVLIYIITSNRTGPRVAQQTYRRLRDTFTTWERLAAAGKWRIERLLAPAGLSRKRASQIHRILRQVKADFGDYTLALLADWDTETAHAYLCGLPGVSDKVAKCVLLFGLRRQVLPVDVHVHRITKRLGWHEHKRADQSHDSLEALVPERLRYAFHVNLIAHGRAVCRSFAPRCSSCILLNWCPTGSLTTVRYLANDPAAHRPSSEAPPSAVVARMTSLPIHDQY